MRKTASNAKTYLKEQHKYVVSESMPTRFTRGDLLNAPLIPVAAFRACVQFNKHRIYERNAKLGLPVKGAAERSEELASVAYAQKLLNKKQISH